MGCSDVWGFVCMVCWMLGLVGGRLNSTASVTVDIQTSSKSATTNPLFTSLSMDVSLVSTGWDTFNFSSPKLHTLMSALSPALFRVGGSPADWLVFDEPIDKLNATGVLPPPILMSKSDWDNMVYLTRKTGTRLLFDLDLQLRYGTQWDPTNAIKLMQYSVSKGYGENIDWELGNEPSSYNKPGEVQIPGTQIGRDFVTLINVVRSYPNFANSLVVGPDIVGSFTGHTKASNITKGFVDVVGDKVNALTFHQYYFRGDVAKWTEYIKPSHFAGLAPMIRSLYKLLSTTKHPNIPVWIGETADAWHSGTLNVSDRYISGFLWLDKLGVAASMGIGVVMRQTFYGHNYALIDIDLNPNPDYWLSLLHKKLAGTTVLNVQLHEGDGSLRAYAHCTNTASGYQAGAVTVYALNINQTESRTMLFSGGFETQHVDVYLLTPYGSDGLLSKFVALNGVKLELLSDTQLPPLKPLHSTAKSGITLPPLTFGFFVFPEAQAPACRTP